MNHLNRRSLLTLLAAAGASATPLAQAAVLPDLGAAPEFSGIEHWLNSAPLTMAGLKGRVVLVDFWTFECINCFHTVPHVVEWNKRFAASGLTIVGVHTPEFDAEKSTANVQAAIKRLGIEYPVAQDNGYVTWNAWHNRYWPAFYLVDKRGRIRYTHFGEESYDETAAAISALLAEK